MENQQNKSLDKLPEFRREIDKIDDQIIDLLKERMKIVAQVGEYKRSCNEHFLIKSSREADMIKDLVIKADGALPKSTIVSLWRKIITSANMLEQEIKIALHNPAKIPDYEYLVKEYYGDFIPIYSHDSVTSIISFMERNEIQIGIFAIPNENDNFESGVENWWINLANNKSNIKIFAKIPFIENINDYNFTKKNLVAVAIKEAESSKEDKTLLVIETAKEISKSQIQNAIKDSAFEGRIIKTAKLKQIDNINFSLIEIDGFHLQTDEKITAFSKHKIKPYVKVIGHFPTPIKF